MPRGHSTQKGRIPVGAIIGSHGVCGTVKVKPFTTTLDSLGHFAMVYLEDGQQVAVKILSAGGKGVLLVRLGKIESRDASDGLRGQHIYVDRDALPALAADEIYHADLLGLVAVSRDGDPFGSIVAIHNFGAGDIVEIAPVHGPTIMLPFSGTALVAIELDKARVVLAPPDGLLDADGDINEDADDGDEKEKGNS